MRRAAIVTLILGASLGAAPAASAQDVPPKPTRAELRAQARPIGDAALELRRALKPLRARDFSSSLDRIVACVIGANIDEEDLEELPVEAEIILGATLFRALAEPYARPMARFVDRVEALEIDDRIVDDGIAAWARLSASMTRLASIPELSCPRFVAWIRSGFSPSKRPPVPTVNDKDIAAFVRVDPAMSRGGLRLLQLGVKSRAARGFLAPDFFGLGSGITDVNDSVSVVRQRLRRR